MKSAFGVEHTGIEKGISTAPFHIRQGITGARDAFKAGGMAGLSRGAGKAVSSGMKRVGPAAQGAAIGTRSFLAKPRNALAVGAGGAAGVGGGVALNRRNK